METAPDHPLVRLTEEAVRRVDGHHPVRRVACCTDASDLALAGIPCVVLGHGHIDQAHTAAEYVEIQQALKAAARGRADRLDRSGRMHGSISTRISSKEAACSEWECRNY